MGEVDVAVPNAAVEASVVDLEAEAVNAAVAWIVAAVVAETPQASVADLEAGRREAVREDLGAGRKAEAAADPAVVNLAVVASPAADSVVGANKETAVVMGLGQAIQNPVNPVVLSGVASMAGATEDLDLPTFHLVGSGAAADSAVGFHRINLIADPSRTVPQWDHLGAGPNPLQPTVGPPASPRKINRLQILARQWSPDSGALEVLPAGSVCGPEPEQEAPADRQAELALDLVQGRVALVARPAESVCGPEPEQGAPADRQAELALDLVQGRVALEVLPAESVCGPVPEREVRATSA